MRIISITQIKQFAAAMPKHKRAATGREMMLWCDVVLVAEWKNFADVKATFGARVDQVKVSSGRTVIVFDVCNNNFRLIGAVHFVAGFPIKGRVYVLRIMTHAEYDLKKWQREL